LSWFIHLIGLNNKHSNHRKFQNGWRKLATGSRLTYHSRHPNM